MLSSTYVQTEFLSSVIRKHQCGRQWARLDTGKGPQLLIGVYGK